MTPPKVAALPTELLNTYLLSKKHGGAFKISLLPTGIIMWLAIRFCAAYGYYPALISIRYSVKQTRSIKFTYQNIL